MTKFHSRETEINMASSWREVTVSQMLRLSHRKDPKDLCEILSIISDKDYKFWFNAEITSFSIEELVRALAWVNDTPDFKSLPVPKEIKIGDKMIPVPDNLEIKTLGQQLAFIQMVFPIVHETGDIIDAIHIALAIYLQPLITDMIFDADTLKETISLCEQCLIMEAFPIASFFLIRSLDLEKEKTN